MVAWGWRCVILLISKRHRERFQFLFVVILSWVLTFVKVCWSVCLKVIHFIVHELHLSKVYFKEEKKELLERKGKIAVIQRYDCECREAKETTRKILELISYYSKISAYLVNRTNQLHFWPATTHKKWNSGEDTIYNSIIVDPRA